VHIQPISTVAESVGLGVLRRTFAGTGWVLAPRISIQSVLAKDEALSETAFSLFTRGHFDCVVCHEDDNIPVFAVEFDGYGHDTPRQIARDRMKNLLCMVAGLPLLRVSTDELLPREQISVLEWLVQVFTSYEATMDDLDDEDEPDSPDDDDAFDPDEPTAGFQLDEDGPTFEIEHPFPGNATILARLLSRFGMVEGVEGPIRIGRADEPYFVRVRWPGVQRFEEGGASQFVVSERKVEVYARGKPDTLFAATGRARFAWAHRLPDRVALGELMRTAFLAPEQVKYRLQQRLSPLDLDWLEASGVARELAAYNALSQVERWAEREVAQMGKG